MRDDLVVQLQAIDDGDRPAVLAGVRARRDQSLDKLARYEKMRVRMLAGRTEEEFSKSSERVGPYLTLLGGRMSEEQNIAWSEAVPAVLEKRRTMPLRRVSHFLLACSNETAATPAREEPPRCSTCRSCWKTAPAITPTVRPWCWVRRA
jgi:hypothetical protein